MDPRRFDPEAYVDAASAAIGLPIDPAHRPGVVHYTSLAARMAAMLDGVPLGPADEPAPVYRP